MSRKPALTTLLCVGAALGTPQPAAAEDFTKWPPLTSTFPSTGGGGIIIKGYDPVVSKGKCITTFMAVEQGADPAVYLNVVEFDAVAEQGGVLCTNGKWRAIDGSASGTTPFRVFFKNGIAYGKG
ncbi:MAG: hypothetical protein NW205_13205 [Hyphomicrobiaceae bacterium]|nr:hypothetical protein [Hyphomicrobiaceae bacterium]